MGTPMKMQHYMERHRISALFEEMMNKVLHDQPEDPLLYMIKALYKKKGMEIPPELKLGAYGLRKSSPEQIIRRSKSPEMSKRTSAQHWGSSSTDPAPGRGYEKPWQSHSKKTKPKELEEKSPPKGESPCKTSKYLNTKGNIRPHSAHASSSLSKSGISSPSRDVPQVSFNTTPTFSKFATSGSNLEDILQVTPISPGRKQKQAWNSDNKVTSSTFDELFEGKPPETKPTKKDIPHVDSRKAWASMGLEEGEFGDYSSKNYRGPRRSRLEEDDPLAGEIKVVKSPESVEKANIKSTGHVKGRDVDAKKHRKNLEKLIQERASDDSGYMEEDDGQQDEAIELLEDGEELRREGARHISKDGYRLSRIMRERQEEPKVKLNIKTYVVANDEYIGGENLTDYDDDDRPPTGLSGYNPSPGDSDVDEEFESVSQVTGPRRPVWNVMDSDGESYQPRPSKTLPEPTRSTKYDRGLTDRKFASTVPVRFEEPPYPSRSMESADSFLQGGKTWSPRMEPKEISRDSVQESVRSGKGGWQLLRYESDTSLAEWSTTGKSLTQKHQSRAY